MTAPITSLSALMTRFVEMSGSCSESSVMGDGVPEQANCGGTVALSPGTSPASTEHVQLGSKLNISSEISVVFDEEAAEFVYKKIAGRESRSEVDAIIKGYLRIMEKKSVQAMLRQPKPVSSDVVKCLYNLVALKEYKDKYGKDEYYERMQPDCWAQAKAVLEEAGVKYVD